MTRASAAAFAVITAIAIACLTGGVVVVVEACENVPSMSMDDACLKASTSQPLLRLCHGELLNAPESGELTVYAVIGAKMAQWSYEASSQAAARLLENPSLPGDERAAYEACARRYASARSLVMDVQTQLLGCSYGSPKQELIDARVHVEACGGELWRFTASPLYAMNADDQLKATLAYELTGLIIGK
ncbi:hypothetical protein E2562_038322 [Oryza meyeriana var. granulata]|uniref:Pectinesterase inhibitor domain-containing protein n=1 Tax=Oryza meyeriana var. granulata TaxID=110450 RepID=A0A6G1CM25_9ORYZ|nr:hypothetical protein E2562_038322 [Oryza meyeriana var. granulata]